MTTTQITVTTQYNVTLEQIDKATRIIDMKTNTVFYQVESQTDPTQDPYRVEWNERFHKLTCSCAAGQQGIPCWHIRAALAAETLNKAEIRRQRQAEQAVIEATKAYRLEQGLHQIEQAMRELDEIFADLAKYEEEVDEREAMRQAGLNA